MHNRRNCPTLISSLANQGKTTSVSCWLRVISNPNLLGLECQLSQCVEGFVMLSGSTSYMCLYIRMFYWKIDHFTPLLCYIVIMRYKCQAYGSSARWNGCSSVFYFRMFLSLLKFRIPWLFFSVARFFLHAKVIASTVIRDCLQLSTVSPNISEDSQMTLVF